MPDTPIIYSQNIIVNCLVVGILSMLCIPSQAQEVLNSNASCNATVFLDFDGHYVSGTAWNWEGDISAQPSGLNQSVINEIFNRIAEDYRIFNINITTDSILYKNAPADKRVRIIFTPTHEWYGKTGGVAFINSFTWGDGTPAFVFSELLQKNPKFVSEAASHEIGHTLGLQHQSVYDEECQLVNEYYEGKGDGEISWAPIMGMGYYRNITTWTVGANVEGCLVIQNDIDIISNGLNNIGLRSDDHGNTRQTATPLPVYHNHFESNGMINSAADKDIFTFSFTRNSLLKADINPNHVGLGNSGANLDIKAILLNFSGDTIGIYNPADLLSASVDTNLSAGTYFLAIDGVENSNVPDYGSLGFYSLSGSVPSVLPVTRLILKGETGKNGHRLQWNFEADEPVVYAVLEYSSNGIDFKNIATVYSSSNHYLNKPFGNGILYYRVKIVTAQDDRAYYSNIISLQYSTPGNISLLSNRIYSNAILNVDGNYAYQLMDETGRLLQSGRLHSGVNTVPVNSIKTGLLLLKVYNAGGQTLFRLIKQ